MALPRPPSLPLLVLPDLGDDTLNPFEQPPEIPPQSAMRNHRTSVNNKKSRSPNSTSGPQHPIPCMQLAFEESLEEAITIDANARPKLRVGDAKYRRELLLDQADGTRRLESDLALWRRRPGQKCHELLKLIAQIAFGVYLLTTGQANSERQVVGFLQQHIDDVDEFLEVTMEDLEFTIDDLTDRMSLLSLPMENIEVFEQMLEDRSYRFSVVNGNEKIEKILTIVRRCLEETVKDIAEGLDAARQFSIYLSKEQDGAWRSKRPRAGEIFNAMKRNMEGWFNALMELQSRTQTLDGLLKSLSTLVSDMDRKAGEVSRRTRFSINPYSLPGSEPQSGNTTPRASIIYPTRQTPSVVVNTRDSSARRASGSSAGLSDLAVRLSTRESRESLSTFQLRMPPRSIPDIVTESHEEDEDEKNDGEDTDRPNRDTAHNSSSPVDDDDFTADAGPLFILQPRTYTPQPPAPVPSPLAESHPERPLSPLSPISPRSPHRNRTSLRDRVAQKVQPPESIQVPPPDALEFHRHVFPSPRQAAAYPVPDSAYGSDVERRPTINSIVTDVSGSDLSPPTVRRALVPSPRSDQQRYFPVQASPHSPLQQRPWTAGEYAFPQNSLPVTQGKGSHIRNKPSQMNMSMLSNVTSVSDVHSDAGHSSKTATTVGTKLKKKKSAFGWFKKAFSMDDEERAQYENRKFIQSPNPYMDSRSPKYLDGKKLTN